MTALLARTPGGAADRAHEPGDELSPADHLRDDVELAGTTLSVVPA
ncbi:hypothetical protein [Quadrisphaera granulorum]|nr:hypothetical protein [Quadrisphaera granulorum]